MEKLYVVVRGDLSPGDQLAQSAHAVSAFARTHRELHDAWSDSNKNLVILAIENEAALEDLLLAATQAGIPWSDFHEPDLRNERTACAFTDGVSKLVSSLPLALRRRCPTCKAALRGQSCPDCRARIVVSCAECA
jgi:hypothetical protein